MYKKQFVVVLVLLFSIANTTYGQEASFTNTIENFIVKKRRFYSEKYANRINKIHRKESEKMKGKTFPGSNIPLPPSLPTVVANHIKGFLYFTITPKHYIEYSIVNNVFESDSLIAPATTVIKKIDREDLSVTEFIPLWFETRTSKLYDKHICTYVIEKEDKNNIKYISGYKCFKVTMYNAINPYYALEMYVTKDIKLNYHPVMNCKETLNKYFPLYIKIFSKDYPNDDYEEYLFVKSKY